MFTDQSDPRQNWMANQIIDSFWSLELGEPVTANLRKFLAYVKKVWFRPNSGHFVGSFSNFHQDILTEITPQMTNNCSESLNSSLRKFFTSGYNPKYKVAEGNIIVKTFKKIF